MLTQPENIRCLRLQSSPVTAVSLQLNLINGLFYFSDSVDQEAFESRTSSNAYK